MDCPSCGAPVAAGQKFCMECGVALNPQHAPTRKLPIGEPRLLDEPTTPLGVGERQAPFDPPIGRREDPRRVPVPAAHEPTVEMAPQPASTVHAGPATAVITRPTPLPLDDTGELPVVPARRVTDHQHRFRLRPALLLGVLAVAATAVAAFTPLLEIAATGADFPTGVWRVNDLGTNNAVAGLLAASAIVVGAIAWCFGFQWGSGLAGGGGAALAGWAALVIGVAELPVAEAQRSSVAAVIERPYGYWVLIGAGAVGVVALLVSLASSGRGGRSGLDPWIAALGAVSFLLAAGGPLLPEGTADWTGNFSSETLQVDRPTLYFVGRGVQLGLLALCGVVGFLLVRRWGLGLALGSAVAAGWLLVTAATERTDLPIGPGYANPADPAALDLRPHAVTIVGFAMVGFFGLVAVVMAAFDTDR